MKFEQGNERLNELLSEPETARQVAAVQAIKSGTVPIDYETIRERQARAQEALITEHELADDYERGDHW